MRRQIQCQMSGAAKGALGIQGTRGTVLGGLAQRTHSPVCSASGPLKGTTCCPWFLCPGCSAGSCPLVPVGTKLLPALSQGRSQSAAGYADLLACCTHVYTRASSCTLLLVCLTSFLVP